MNIFYLDSVPAFAAQQHCDKHVVKMILESAQMLCTAQHLHGKIFDNIYRKSFVNHPCALWVRANEFHYNWLYDLFVALCEEYNYRYNKVHLTWTKMGKELESPPNLPKTEFFQPPQCMPNYCKAKCSIEAYRTYYVYEKLPKMFAYTKREVPLWVKEWYNA